MAIPLGQQEDNSKITFGGSVDSQKYQSILALIWKILAGVLFLIGIVTVILYFWLNQRLLPQLDTLKEDIATLSVDKKIKEAGKFTVLQSQLQILKKVLGEHVYSSNIFKIVEEFTHPKVIFRNLSFTARTRNLEMDGLAGSFQVMAEQIRILENVKDFEKFQVGGISLESSDRVSFHLSAVFKPSVLHK